MLPLRSAARVLVVDDEGATLLFRGDEPGRSWWFTPGGGLETGESAREAAVRELREETGLVPDRLGDTVFEHTVEVRYKGVTWLQHEDFFVVRTPRFEVDEGGWTSHERALVQEHRWWTPAEISGSAETIYPENLVALLEEFARFRP